jgi:hypothetical protein
MSDEKLVLAGEILDILHDVWPKPSHATVHLESHQWIRLRRILLETIGHLVEEDDRAAVPANSNDVTVFIPAIRDYSSEVPPYRVSPGTRPQYPIRDTPFQTTDLRGHGEPEDVPGSDGRRH